LTASGLKAHLHGGRHAGRKHYAGWHLIDMNAKISVAATLFPFIQVKIAYFVICFESIVVSEKNSVHCFWHNITTAPNDFAFGNEAVIGRT
jgi:hypothetical protein